MHIKEGKLGNRIFLSEKFLRHWNCTLGTRTKTPQRSSMDLYYTISCVHTHNPSFHISPSLLCIHTYKKHHLPQRFSCGSPTEKNGSCIKAWFCFCTATFLVDCTRSLLKLAFRQYIIYSSACSLWWMNWASKRQTTGLACTSLLAVPQEVFQKMISKRQSLPIRCKPLLWLASQKNKLGHILSFFGSLSVRLGRQ